MRIGDYGITSKKAGKTIGLVFRLSPAIEN